MPTDFCAGNVDLCPRVAGCNVPVSLEGCGLPSMPRAEDRGPDLCLFSRAGSQRVGGQRRAGRQCWSPLSRGSALQHSCTPGVVPRSLFPPSSTGLGQARAASGSAWNHLDLAEGAHRSLECAVRGFAPSALHSTWGSRAPALLLQVALSLGEPAGRRQLSASLTWKAML